MKRLKRLQPTLPSVRRLSQVHGLNAEEQAARDKAKAESDARKAQEVRAQCCSTAGPRNARGWGYVVPRAVGPRNAGEL